MEFNKLTNNFKIVLIYIFMIDCINLQVIPENPCPNLFKYVNTYGQVHGRVEFKNDNSGSYYLAVNMSVASYLGSGQNIKLELKTPPNDIIRGSSLVYNIYFPSRYAIPKPTRIEFNKEVYCSSPSEQVRPGGYVTNLWANTFFKFTITHGPDELPQLPLDSFTIQTPITVTEPNGIVQFTLQPTPQNEVINSTTDTAIVVDVATRSTIVTPAPIDYSECGKPSIITIHLVANGDDVEEGQCPWLAAIMFKSGNEYEYRCTGTLVSDRHVITAGHCLQYGKAPLFPVEELIVVLGTASLKNWILSSTIRGVSQISTHPNYVEDSADNDISVVTLNKPVEFSKTVSPICLWGDESSSLEHIVGKEGTVAGWGSDRPHGENSVHAQRTNLPVVSQSVCLQSNIGFKSITSVRTFCAGRRDNAGPCTGDSGAGFVMFRNGRWVLRGVISIPLKDSDNCDLENYFVFADLAQVKGWLSTQLT